MTIAYVGKDKPMSTSSNGTSYVDIDQATLNAGTFERAVKSLTRYKPGTTFEVRAMGGAWQQPALMFRINLVTLDSNEPSQQIIVRHEFYVPQMRLSEDEWIDWCFECILAAERHEAGEWLWVNGERPFMPDHGPGSDPYNVRRRTHRRAANATGP